MEVGCLEMRATIDEESNLNGMSGGSNDTIENKVRLFQQLHQDIKNELCAHTWEITRYHPLQFIISHTDHYQILYATVENKINPYLDNQGKDTGAGVLKSNLKLRN